LNEPSSYIFKNILLQSLERGNITENNKAIIQDLIEQGIEFVDDMILDDITIANLDEITTCFNTNTNAINCPTNGICSVDNGICKLLLPRINLVNKQTDNKISYYEKLIDELLRYKRIRNYIFEPDAYLAIRETNFKLHNDEYLIYESELNQDKLNELKNKEKKHKLHKNIHELSQPDKVLQKYNKLFTHGHYF